MFETIATDPRIAIVEAAVAALPAEVAALAVIDTSALPDPDSAATVTVGDWYARICHNDCGGPGFVAYLGFDLYSAPTARYADTAEELVPVVAAWIDQPGPTYAEVSAIESDLMSLARRLWPIQDDGTAEQITAEVRTLDPAAEALSADPDGFEYPHLVTVHGRQLHLSHEAAGKGKSRGWMWRLVDEAA